MKDPNMLKLYLSPYLIAKLAAAGIIIDNREVVPVGKLPRMPRKRKK